MTSSELSFHFAHANGFPAGSYSAMFSALHDHFHRLHVERFGHDPQLPVNGNWRNQVQELIKHIKREQGSARRVWYWAFIWCCNYLWRHARRQSCSEALFYSIRHLLLAR